MNRKYSKRKLPKFFFIISLALFLFIGIGYSIINSNLSMQGNVVRKATTWNIGFSNPVFDTGSITSPTPTITNGTTMTMNVSLASPGDIYAFTVDLKNTGSVPALINTLSITELTSEQQNYLRWKVEYEDESTPAVGDLLKAGETKKVHIYLEYKKLRATDLYPTSNVNLTLTITANFILPEETFNTVTITKNGSTKLIQVSNLEQEVTLTDFPIESTDQVIACNNGVEPSTDTNDKIVLSKVKQNATCRIEPSLASAVTNSSTEVTNMAILQDATTTSIVSVGSTQIINLNLNGKQYIISPDDITNYSITINGNLNINGKTTNSILKTTGQWLLYNNNAGVTNVNGGTYIKDCSSTTGAVASGGGTLNINNASFSSYNTLIIYTRVSNALFNINNSVVTASNNQVIANWASNSIINIRNTTISASANGISLGIGTISGYTYTYLCDSTISLVSSGTDFNSITETTRAFYSNGNIFKSGTNTPTLPTNSLPYVMKSDIACAE